MTTPLLQHEFLAKTRGRGGRSTFILAADTRLSGEELFIIIAPEDSEISIHAYPGHSTCYFVLPL